MEINTWTPLRQLQVAVGTLEERDSAEATIMILSITDNRVDSPGGPQTLDKEGTSEDLHIF